ncbi:hypothetical protein ACE6H2_003092 [Prunus campanulata]
MGDGGWGMGDGGWGLGLVHSDLPIMVINVDGEASKPFLHSDSEPVSPLALNLENQPNPLQVSQSLPCGCPPKYNQPFLSQPSRVSVVSHT